MSNDIDEKKRREERRKSLGTKHNSANSALHTNTILARRRVSFNPEATLHSWDVVAYARDETSSSAASEATRRASSVSQEPVQPSSDAEEPPSTPPERVEEPVQEPESSPVNQRDAHRKKNRRGSSGVPPMNFNNPDDILSSSPLAEIRSLPIDGVDDAPRENDSQSSAKLDAALRKASELAGTQRLDLESDEEMSMVMAEDEITASFKPWTKKQQTDLDDKENDDPFANSSAGSDESGDDMSMDITRAVGKIIPQAEPQAEPDSSGSEGEDMSMDLTMAIGGIKTNEAKELANRRKSLKRRISMLEPSQGSPAPRPSSRRTSLRSQTSPDNSAADDQTMDFTMAIGAIKSQAGPTAEPPAKKSRASVDSSVGDETMDFTVAVGKIKEANATAEKIPVEDNESGSEDMDMSMEFTTVVGPGIKRLEKAPTRPDKATPTNLSPMKKKMPTPQNSPQKSPARLQYPDLTTALSAAPMRALKMTPSKSPYQPRRSWNVTTPESKPEKQRIEDFEPSPFVRSTPQSASKSMKNISTPTSQPRNAPLIIPDDPIEAPILNRRRSSLSNVQFSPLAPVTEEPSLRSTAILTNNIKLLSTPRKQTLNSPVKRGLTPKKSQTPQKNATPTPKKSTPRKSMSPKKKIMFADEPNVKENIPGENIDEVLDDTERISLQEFLNLTRIRFMDLNTTKRRHTAAPAAFHNKELEEKEETLDQYVVAGACISPEFELYLHACHEMKKYISSGRDFVRTLEENVEEENPLLFTEYLTAPPDQRAIMDNQFKNLKTSARLDARAEWYTWRSTLLQNLKSGLLSTMADFKQDESIISGQEQLLDKVLPPLEETKKQLDEKHRSLQQRHDELNSCDREELEKTRERLVAVDAEVEDKRQLLAQLQQELAERESSIEAVKERKVECAAEIKAAERVREECRGWSTTEVNELQGKRPITTARKYLLIVLQQRFPH